MLASFCRHRSLHLAQYATRQIIPTRTFVSSPILEYSKHRNKSKIRIPSKKSQLAKDKRRAAKLAKAMEKTERLTLAEAVNVLRAVEVASPNATYELQIRTQVGSGMALPRGRVNLPREPKAKKEDIILVFAEGRLAEEAKKAGAQIVGGLELVEQVATGRTPASTILCSPALIRGITPKLGRVLGPRGMMPSERRGTVTEDIAGYIQRLRGSREWKGDRKGTIRTAIGKITFPPEDVVKNVRHFLSAVKKVTGSEKDVPVKGSKEEMKPVVPIVKVMLSSTQGPGISLSDF